MAIAPNASTGLVLGTSPGVDPRFAQNFSRQTSNGKFLDINHNLVKDLQKMGIWEKVKNQVLENYGDISNIDEIPENLKSVYKTSFQISPYAYIEVASRAQKWIDQAISRNIYLETRDIDEMIEIYTEAWRRGVKTTYYLHVKPRHQAEQSTVRVNKAEKLNKKGFGGMAEKSSQTSQASLLGDTKERKGFGFASVTAEASITQPAFIGSSIGGASVGFAVVRQEVVEKVGLKETLEQKVELTHKSKVPPIACPVDPAERALCEACQ
jgi:ribonucleoside-diphosphate reductase alpha chain